VYFYQSVFCDAVLFERVLDEKRIYKRVSLIVSFSCIILCNCFIQAHILKLANMWGKSNELIKCWTNMECKYIHLKVKYIQSKN